VWHPRFPASDQIADCAEPFRQSLNEFVLALRGAGASVTIANTFRPPERAYLMHWCWRIVKEGFDPRNVPSMAGVLIQWAHVDNTGRIPSNCPWPGRSQWCKRMEFRI